MMVSMIYDAIAPVCLDCTDDYDGNILFPFQFFPSHLIFSGI